LWPSTSGAGTLMATLGAAATASSFALPLLLLLLLPLPVCVQPPLPHHQWPPLPPHLHLHPLPTQYAWAFTSRQPAALTSLLLSLTRTRTLICTNPAAPVPVDVTQAGGRRQGRLLVHEVRAMRRARPHMLSRAWLLSAPCAAPARSGLATARAVCRACQRSARPFQWRLPASARR
jgi:hypothetical protein